MEQSRPIAEIIDDYRMETNAFRMRQEDRIDNDPLIARLDERIGQLGMEKIRRALDGLGSELIDRQMRQLETSRNARLSAIGGMQYLCAACHDTGKRPHGGFCTCLRKRIYLEHYGAMDPMRSPVTLDTYDLSIFDDTVPVSERDHKTQHYVAGLALNLAREVIGRLPGKTPGMFLHGEPGLGKSWLVAAMARQAEEKGIDTAFIHAFALFDAYHRERLGEPVDMKFIETAKLLIIDDLGAEPITRNVTMEALLRLLTYRSEHQLPTVISSNQEDIQDRYGERISSRILSQDFVQLRMEGTDLRRKKDSGEQL